MAAHAGELPPFPGRIGFAADRMDPADIVTDQNVLARSSFFMTLRADTPRRIVEDVGNIGSVRSVTLDALARHNRLMDVFF